MRETIRFCLDGRCSRYGRPCTCGLTRSGTRKRAWWACSQLSRRELSASRSCGSGMAVSAHQRAQHCGLKLSCGRRDSEGLRGAGFARTLLLGGSDTAVDASACDDGIERACLHGCFARRLAPFRRCYTRTLSLARPVPGAAESVAVHCHWPRLCGGCA